MYEIQRLKKMYGKQRVVPEEQNIRIREKKWLAMRGNTQVLLESSSWQ